MFFPALLLCAASVVIGLDFGSEYIKIGVAPLGRQVHVALNEHNTRISPAYFAIWNASNVSQPAPTRHWSLADIRACSWSFLDAARTHYLSYPDHVFHGLVPLTGDHNGLMRREYAAILIKHLLSTIDNSEHEPVSCHIVMAVDPALSRQDRYILQEIVKMAGADLKQIVDAPTAAAHLYALEKSYLFQKAPKIVVIIDIGATKTWMSVFNFTERPREPLVRQMGLPGTAHIGGNDIDSRLAEHLEGMFLKKGGKSLSERAHLRFVAEARAAKERLSVNSAAEVRIDDLVEFGYDLGRSEFEELLGDACDGIEKLYAQVLTNAGISRERVDSVELLGGSGRIPVIQEVILRVSGVARLNRTMNSDEAVALGAAYIGATQSADFVAPKKVRLDPLCNTNVSIIHHGNRTELFNETNYMSDSTTYQFKVRDNGNVSILAGSPPVNLIDFEVVVPETARDNVTVSIDFGFDEYTLPGIYNVRLNRLTAQNVTFHSPSWALNKMMFNRSVSFLKRMDVVLGERRETEKAFNDFESFLYDTQKRLEHDDAVHKVTTPDELARLTQITNENLFWLLNKTHKMPLTARIITDKAKQMNKTIQDVYLKAKELPKREPAFAALWAKIEECQTALDVTWPVTRPWMPEKKRKTMQSAIDHAIKYYHIYREQQGNRSETEMPGVRARDVKMQTYYLEMTYNHTLKTTKHPPTPKPAKTPNPYYKVYNSAAEFEADLERNREREIFGERPLDSPE
jgi:molecular chaperone DnaK (HSP70)